MLCFFIIDSALDSDGEENECLLECDDNNSQDIPPCIPSVESQLEQPVEVDYSQYDKFFQELFDSQKVCF